MKTILLLSLVTMVINSTTYALACPAGKKAHKSQRCTVSQVAYAYKSKTYLHPKTHCNQHLYCR